MLKTVSAALLAVSMVAAPAMAGTVAKTATAAPAATSTAAPVVKADQPKAKVLNANAKMSRHHYRHARHHNVHKNVGVSKAHAKGKVAVKHISPAGKRG